MDVSLAESEADVCHFDHPVAAAGCMTDEPVGVVVVQTAQTGIWRLDWTRVLLWVLVLALAVFVGVVLGLGLACIWARFRRTGRLL
jgi:hypothetical protein